VRPTFNIFGVGFLGALNAFLVPGRRRFKRHGAIHGKANEYRTCYRWGESERAAKAADVFSPQLQHVLGAAPALFWLLYRNSNSAT
jgi:hypothetical protein